MKINVVVLLLWSLFPSFLRADLIQSGLYQEKPKLAVVLVIDQFRSDFLTRFPGRFLPASSAKGELGGFRYLMDKGAYIPYGEYEVLQNMTGPGHAMILSGTYPYNSGIALNNWFDQGSQDGVYCAEDKGSKTIGIAGDAKAHVGTSPKNMVATNLGDEMKNAGLTSKVYSIALKDRASIFMGGKRADLSLWFDQDYYQWVSSEYYLPKKELPTWVQELNTKLRENKGKDVPWQRLGKQTLVPFDNNILPLEKWVRNGFNVSFPHQIRIGTKHTLNTPVGVDYTIDAAIAMIQKNKLGQGKHTDLLAVSISTHDYLGHEFGPNSEEMEEMTLYEDRAIAKLFNAIQKQVPGGMNSVVIVLTADHGIPPVPEYLQKEKIAAGRIDDKKLLEEVNQVFDAKYGKLGEKEKWVPASKEMNFWFNHPAIAKKELAVETMEMELKKIIAEKTDGVIHLFSASDVKKGTLPPGMFQEQIRKSYYPGRSGDVVAILKPFYFSGEHTTGHMTGYAYDRTVPILFAGKRIKKGILPQAHVVDIAPTLSFLMGIVPPAMSEGRVLGEIIR